VRESTIAIREFLTHTVMEKGFRKEFADVECKCGGRVFLLGADTQFDSVSWMCVSCETHYCLEATLTYTMILDELANCSCPCDLDRFEIGIGVSLYPINEVVSTAYIAGMCVHCGKITCFDLWSDVDLPYSLFFTSIYEP